jgi:secreted trypsin-like serine protease
MKTRLSHLIIALSACMCLSCDASQQPNPGDFSARSLPIINGTPVSGDDHLATVAMVLNYTTGPDAFCTGTLITPNYVLTAAHCISQCQGDSTNIEEYRPHMSVAIGQSEATFRKIIPIKAFHPHPKFYCSPYRISNDIAIVQLAEPVHLAEVTPILPIPPVFDMTADEVDNTGVDVVTVGFGLTNPNNNASSGKKYMTEQRVYAYCPTSGEQSRLCGTQLTDTDGFIYFNATNTGTCQGDSGGPTFMKRDGIDYVVGVTSYGYEECRYVTAMTLVSEHFDFIAGIVKDLSADSPENCTNQIDDNGDGRIDCKDPYCFHIKQCVPEECVNQKDDNEDGFTDCEDPQCASELLCQPEDCTNKVDDNGNGLIDCNDLQCFGTLICTPENCANGIDDNGNGLTDCEETETCSKSLNCIPENCSNRKDDNGNMLKFKVRQLPATEQEKLIIKILLLVANKDVAELDVEKLRENPQMAVNAKVIMSAIEKLDYEKIEPISNTLLSCCYRIVGNMEEQCTPETVNGYVESFWTLLSLKKAALEVSFDFFEEDGNSQATTSKATIEIGKSSQM